LLLAPAAGGFRVDVTHQRLVHRQDRGVIDVVRELGRGDHRCGVVDDGLGVGGRLGPRQFGLGNARADAVRFSMLELAAGSG
jgi:hypothetical protein